jgi:hypothetical protein
MIELLSDYSLFEIITIILLGYILIAMMYTK